jgi:hypothetical protein
LLTISHIVDMPKYADNFNFRSSIITWREFGHTGKHHDHPKRCAVPKMNSDRILLCVNFLELVQEHQPLDATPSWTSVVVADRLEIQALESQVVCVMEKWGHEKQLEEPNKQNISVLLSY